MPLVDLLQWLGESRKTGTLTLVLEFEERYLRFDEGAVSGIASDDARVVDLGRALLRSELLDDERLDVLSSEAAQSGRTLREYLLDENLFSIEDIASAVRDQAKSCIMQLFFWHEGRFIFSEDAEASLLGDLTPTRRLEPHFEVREILMEGMQRLDEWQRVRELLPTDYTLVYALGRAPKMAILDVLFDAGEPLTLGDLCLRIPHSRVEIMEQLYRAWRNGLVGVDVAPEVIGNDEERSPVDMLVVTATTMFDAAQFDEAASLVRSALDLDPFHQGARSLLRRAKEEHLRELYAQFAPHRVPQARMAFRSLHSLTITPREQFLLSRIDGIRDVSTLTVMTPLSELETLRTLKKLHHVGLVSFSQ